METSETGTSPGRCRGRVPRLGAADLVIAPLIDDVAYYSFYEAEKMIAAGEKAAEAAVDDIRALMAARTPSLVN